MARQARPGWVWRGEVRRGVAGMARRGWARLGAAGQAWHGSDGRARRGRAGWKGAWRVFGDIPLRVWAEALMVPLLLGGLSVGLALLFVPWPFDWPKSERREPWRDKTPDR